MINPSINSSICYVSLGSNMGSTHDNLIQAYNHINATTSHDLFLAEAFEKSLIQPHPLTILGASSLYSTEPQNVKDQPFFLNQVIQIACDRKVTPLMLLHRLLAIEDAMGRVRTKRFGPRIIDLDLLLFDDIIVDSTELILPHPRMAERAFVLIPLLEINESLTYPNGNDVKYDLQKLTYTVESGTIYQY